MKQKRTNRSPQSPKVKSPEARALTLSKRGNVGDRIPSGTAYKRSTKHRARQWDGE